MSIIEILLKYFLQKEMSNLFNTGTKIIKITTYKLLSREMQKQISF